MHIVPCIDYYALKTMHRIQFTEYNAWNARQVDNLRNKMNEIQCIE